jgi:hypothetical protein
MINFVNHISSYASLLQKGAVWQNSTEVLAPVLGDDDHKQATKDYIYEFYCYLCIIVDLKANYKIEFVQELMIINLIFLGRQLLKKISQDSMLLKIVN